ncbi:MAG: GNAT family N-acetyltransferase [Candidatus Thorarchaeota archaeon]
MTITEYTGDFSRLTVLFTEHRRRKPMIDFCLRQSKGRMLVDSTESPTSALLVYRSAHVIAGDITNHGFLEPALSNIPRNIWGLMIPNEEWIPLLTKYWKHGFETIKRIELASDRLELSHLMKYTEVPEGYSLQRFGKQHILNIHMDLLYDAIIDFESFKNFEKEGLAFCVVKDTEDSKIISIASSVYPFTTELEIQVKTHPEYRRQGFALSSSAALIEYCIRNDVKVYVDAAHDGSRDMALKLGFSNPEEWNVYKPM